MSVAENPTTEAVPQNPQQPFAVASGIGALALLAGVGFILAALPSLWWAGWIALFRDYEDIRENVFLGDALLILVELGVIAGLAYGAFRLLQQHTLPGLRAGIFFGAAALFAALSAGMWIGSVMENQDPEKSAVGWAVVIVVMGAILGGAGYLYLKAPGWQRLMEVIEEQGWFHANSYKSNQGVRVRRGSIIGVLAVGGCGIFVMATHKFFGTEVMPTPDNPRGIPNDWFWWIPFTEHSISIPIMFKVHMVMPLLLVGGLVWIAWRIVNIPSFADFLIATEAEMNKVSWTNRKRLVQDTIVVLTTVFLMTSFLFIVDIVLIKVLSAPGIRVLLFNPKDAEKEQTETAKW